jgi:hypothetical protein
MQQLEQTEALQFAHSATAVLPQRGPPPSRVDPYSSVQTDLMAQLDSRRRDLGCLAVGRSPFALKTPTITMRTLQVLRLLGLDRAIVVVRAALILDLQYFS